MAELIELYGDLFQSQYLNQPNTAILHCVSADYALGAGIAAQIESRYHVRNILKSTNRYQYPDCILVNGILNMVTKANYWNKPTYANFELALELVLNVCMQVGITTIIMPRIGCGLDKLDWEHCRNMIITNLVNNGITCLVYSL